MSSLENNLAANGMFNSEALCACLVEAGVDPDKILINYNGGFKKRYNTDLAHCDVDEKNAGPHVKLALNRDGIYDRLPEGLFHQSLGNSRVATVQEAVEEHKKFKKEEQIARNFFAPLEQMLFSYTLATEITERQALYDLQQGKYSSRFNEFWNISSRYPKQEANRLIRLMPYAHLIKGNGKFTAAALAFLLDAEVSFTQKDRLLTAPKQHQSLDKMRLGVTALLDQHYQDCLSCWHFQILVAKPAMLASLVPESSKRLLLQRFEEIFMPMDVEYTYDFEAKVKTDRMDNKFLGYGCQL